VLERKTMAKKKARQITSSGYNSSEVHVLGVNLTLSLRNMML